MFADHTNEFGYVHVDKIITDEGFVVNKAKTQRRTLFKEELNLTEGY
jgi:hypothetical protein